jgi:micrococcal nuclease
VTRGSWFFWSLIVVLLGSALCFGVGAERRRRAVQASEVSLATGDLVTLSSVPDGDTVVVKTADGQEAVIRLLGVKAFPIQPAKDPASYHGQAAVAELGRMLEGKTIRVMLHTSPRDKHGRWLAELFVDDEAVALSLVKKGLVLTYTAYPFPTMPLFLQEQATARAERRGLWRDPDMARRAELLAAEWRRTAQ